MLNIKSGTAGILALGMIAAPVAFFATGCSSAAVAATVNGENIEEQTITDYVQNFRKTNGLESDDTWAQWMVDNGRDAESIRSDAIDYFIRIDVMDQEAAKQGIEITDEQITEQIAEIKKYYGFDDAEFQEQLTAIGYTDESYREYVRQSLVQEKLMQSMESDTEVDDEEVLSQANVYSTALDGAKEITVIEVSGEDLANEVANRAKGGEDFIALQTEYGSTVDYDGWDVMTGIDSNVSAAIEGLNRGAVSEAIESADGETYYVVKVNQVLSVPADGFASVDQIPDTLREEFIKNVQQSALSTEFETWIQGLVDSADVTINPMPSGLPYDVSTDGVEPSTSSASDSSTLDLSDDMVVDDTEDIDGTVVDDVTVDDVEVQE